MTSTQSSPFNANVNITTVEMHTGGEPLRIITSGYPPLKGDTILDKRRYLRNNLDHYRKLLMFEPRGHYDMFGALLVTPDVEGADIGVIFIHNEGYCTMCGHGVIALGRYAIDHGLVKNPVAPETRVGIQCPCGLVEAFVEYQPGGSGSGQGKTGAVRFHSVPAFLFASDYWGGWACFVFSIGWIAVLTAFIGDLASGFGCTVGLKDSVTAISFVALGTSVPDTFASKVAAINDKYADSSVGNVTGSNAVNVFLGIGVAWSIAAIYWAIQGKPFTVPPGTLAVSVTLFCCLAVVCIAVMMIRRQPFIGGELGGETKYKIPTTVFLVGLWLTYVLVSSFVAYCYIPKF